MFNKTSILAVGAALVNLASAIGHAKITNSCAFNVTAWSVGSNTAGPYLLTADGGTYDEVLTKDPTTGGRSLKITLEEDGLYNGKAQTNYAYTLDGDKVWYDLSNVFGDPFKGHKLVVASDNPACPSIVLDDGVPTGKNHVKTCESNSSVTLTLCAK
ncbi:hypothetical protein CDD83_5236 [Cordyceps sp. RAO-2017]|nr:hypothetical protein CDD83_5236 [Cordyceps sp. RAO-2017]